MGKLQNLELLLNPQRNDNYKLFVPEEKCFCYQGLLDDLIKLSVNCLKSGILMENAMAPHSHTLAWKSYDGGAW